MTILGLLVLILDLYRVGGVAINHGIEIFFLLAIIPALMLTNPRTIAMKAYLILSRNLKLSVNDRHAF